MFHFVPSEMVLLGAEDNFDLTHRFENKESFVCFSAPHFLQILFTFFQRQRQLSLSHPLTNPHPHTHNIKYKWKYNRKDTEKNL